MTENKDLLFSTSLNELGKELQKDAAGVELHRDAEGDITFHGTIYGNRDEMLRFYNPNNLESSTFNDVPDNLKASFTKRNEKGKPYTRVIAFSSPEYAADILQRVDPQSVFAVKPDSPEKIKEGFDMWLASLMVVAKNVFNKPQDAITFVSAFKIIWNSAIKLQLQGKESDFLLKIEEFKKSLTWLLDEFDKERKYTGYDDHAFAGSPVDSSAAVIDEPTKGSKPIYAEPDISFAVHTPEASFSAIDLKFADIALLKKTWKLRNNELLDLIHNRFLVKEGKVYAADKHIYLRMDRFSAVEDERELTDEERKMASLLLRVMKGNWIENIDSLNLSSSAKEELRKLQAVVRGEIEDRIRRRKGAEQFLTALDVERDRNGKLSRVEIFNQPLEDGRRINAHNRPYRDRSEASGVKSMEESDAIMGDILLRAMKGKDIPDLDSLNLHPTVLAELKAALQGIRTVQELRKSKNDQPDDNGVKFTLH